MPKYKKDTDIPLPFLKKGETGPQSPTVIPTPSGGWKTPLSIPDTIQRTRPAPEPPQIYAPSSGEQTGPSMMSKKGGPIMKKKYAEGGEVSQARRVAGTEVTSKSGLKADYAPNNPGRRMSDEALKGAKEYTKEVGPNVYTPPEAYNKGGEVKSSSNAQKAQNLLETAANPTSKVGLKKGGVVEAKGHGWRRWGHGR